MVLARPILERIPKTQEDKRPGLYVVEAPKEEPVPTDVSTPEDTPTPNEEKSNFQIAKEILLPIKGNEEILKTYRLQDAKNLSEHLERSLTTILSTNQPETNLAKKMREVISKLNEYLINAETLGLSHENTILEYHNKKIATRLGENKRQFEEQTREAARQAREAIEQVALETISSDELVKQIKKRAVDTTKIPSGTLIRLISETDISDIVQMNITLSTEQLQQLKNHLKELSQKSIAADDTAKNQKRGLWGRVKQLFGNKTAEDNIQHTHNTAFTEFNQKMEILDNNSNRAIGGKVDAMKARANNHDRSMREQATWQR